MQRLPVLHITDLQLNPSPHAPLGALRIAAGRDNDSSFTGQLVGGRQTNTRTAAQDNCPLPAESSYRPSSDSYSPDLPLCTPIAR